MVYVYVFDYTYMLGLAQHRSTSWIPQRRVRSHGRPHLPDDQSAVVRAEAEAPFPGVAPGSRIWQVRRRTRAIAGALHLARLRPDSALPFLREAMPHAPASGYVMSLRAEAFVALGARDSAQAALEQLINEPRFGYEGQDEWQNAPFTLGTMLETKGDKPGAMAAYRQYLERWRDAPAALPRFVAARARLAALSADR